MHVLHLAVAELYPFIIDYVKCFSALRAALAVEITPWIFNRLLSVLEEGCGISDLVRSTGDNLDSRWASEVGKGAVL